MNLIPHDPETIAGIGLAVLGSRDALNKLLGPTAEYIGGELKGLVQKCNINLDNVLSIANKKLGSRLETSGTVNPRVFKHVVEEAVFCEDALVAEYLGGVLASSRSENGRDDRGVCFLTDIKSLSVYQLRTHCLIYTAIAHVPDLMPYNPLHYYGEDEWSIAVVFSDDDYRDGMKYEKGEVHEQIAKHSFLGLRSRLLGDRGLIAYENEGNGGNDDPRFARPWRVFTPTQYGHELFAWGLGLGDRKLDTYFSISSADILSSIPTIQITYIGRGDTHFGGREKTYSPE